MLILRISLLVFVFSISISAQSIAPSSFINLNKSVSDTISFPLEIGNKWYYKGYSYGGPFPYDMIKTIIDTTTDGTRIVKIQQIYPHIVLYDTERWKFSDGKFYVTQSAGNTRGPIFDESIKHDTIISPGYPLYIAYQILDIELFGKSYYGQGYDYSFNAMTTHFGYRYETANRIGISFQLEWEWVYYPLTFELRGVLLDGTFLGDSTFIEWPETITFPLEIGNRWYYEGSPNNQPNPYDMIKTIVDTTYSGLRKVKVQKIYSDNVLNDTEWWKYSEGKFYITSSNGVTVGPIFDAVVSRDTTYHFYPYYFEYKILNTELFGNNYFGQWYYEVKYGQYNIEYEVKYQTADKIGISYYCIPLQDTFNIKGVLLDGIFMGDSSFIEWPDTIEVPPDTNETPALPEDFSLSQNYPNPFNSSTKIIWQSPVDTWQTIKIYDVLGNEVVTLINEYKPADKYEVEFNGTSLPSGIYFYQLKAGDYSETKKMILLK